MGSFDALESLLPMRGHNQGTIHRRKDDGRWMVGVTMPNGRRRFQTLPATATQADAERALSQLRSVRDELAADLTPGSQLGRFLARWIDDAAPSLRPATVRHYRLIVFVHLTPALGRRPISALTPADVQDYLAAASARLAPQTVGHHRAVLRRALNVALRWGLVSRNVATLVDVPRVPKAERGILTASQVAQLLEATADDRLHALYALAATTGMRQAELLGLTWDHVDLEGAKLTVARTLVRHGGAFRMAEPKTDRSRRTIGLGTSTVLALRAHRIRQAQERLAGGHGGPYAGLVFTTRQGAPIHSRSALKAFHRVLERAKLPTIRFHDLRHTAATLMLSQGLTLEDVKQVLGHSTITLTSNTYGHVVEQRSRHVAEVVELALKAAR